MHRLIAILALALLACAAPTRAPRALEARATACPDVPSALLAEAAQEARQGRWVAAWSGGEVVDAADVYAAIATGAPGDWCAVMVTRALERMAEEAY